jgi:NAD(P)-dependent dehydrogenase (short-subunit alcohol dehydrogenase family)
MADTWVVVGASRGIGLELVKQLLNEGKSVIAGARNPSGAAELLQLKQSRPECCVVEQCDVTDEESINVSSH